MFRSFTAASAPIPTETPFVTSVGESRRHLVDRLRAYHLDKYIALPQIAVMGDTSSGKSSVLSAISGITFPSSSTLTTRCPTQLVLSQAPKLSGSARLMRYNGTPEPPTAIASMADVTAAIASLTQQLVDEGQSISDDWIEIALEGPALPDLTLVDLPGLIRTVGDDEDVGMIARVRALVQRFLHQERTIILAVVLANVDVHNTEILHLSKEVDADGTRTMSILTKPDLVDVGSEQAVLDLLANRTMKNRSHGYHMVKCRGQDALNKGVSIEAARNEEATYFATHSVWRSVDTHLLGTGRLATKLSMLLLAFVESELPKVYAEIDTQTADCQRELAAMGPPLRTAGTRRQVYMEHVRIAKQHLDDAAHGQYKGDFFRDGTDDNRLRAQLRRLEGDFQEAIDSLSTIDVNVVDMPKREPLVGDYVEVHEGDDEWQVQKVTKVGSKSRVLTAAHSHAWLERGSEWRFMTVLDTTELKQLMLDSRGDELSLFLSYTTFANVTEQHYLSAWEAPMQTLFEGYKALLAEVTRRAIISTQAPTGVQQHLERIANQVLTTCADATKPALDKIMHKEKRPYTQNDAMYRDFTTLRYQPLMQGLDALSANVSMGAVKALLQMHASVGSVSNEDAQATDLHHAISAYLHVAKKRFTDLVPMELNSTLVESYVMQLARRWETMDATDEILERILFESDADALRRDELGNKLEALRRAKDDIDMP
ncbi:hypothetical protein SPRG_07904 [Saprolegnia parasitica CBS 223.65]|uniref:Dynamin-type G domain-containing protein n=1 Tax=Saprolegnia parasitica (strain CBS 223.65) TaxID=695850 RepID=A0A067CIW7_SAPPC|nr:hypothetical protein SPRG_07904 [Saprolegnia parasitica CBS 223.65]KDO26501.1 hypothetical protein SPRG_07904 [Saprolegnia parasitica CBS 223.65]|eukprot:XP_012202646.1 hypothetical protein SPRG_07904 [Saprolegnia parasitica CBS 223.65]